MTPKLFFTGFRKGMKNYGNSISLIINTLLLSAVYLIGVGITKIFSKFSRKSFLETKKPSESKTYWSDLNLKKKPINEYYRQF